MPTSGFKTYSYRGCIVRVHETVAAKRVGGIAEVNVTGRKRKPQKRRVIELCAGPRTIPLKDATDADFEAALTPFARRFAPLPKGLRPRERNAEPAKPA